MSAREEWRERAACAGSGVDFFPMPGDAKGIALAQSFCRRCEVVGECAAFAEGETWGVWAGVQRQSVRVGIQGYNREWRQKRARQNVLSDAERTWLEENVG